MRASPSLLLVSGLALGACQPSRQPSMARDSERAGAITTATPAPDFTAETLDGHVFHLAEQKGKVVVLDFFLTSNQACVQALGTAQRLSDEHRKDGLIALAIAIDPPESRPTVRTYVSDRRLTVPVVVDTDGKLTELFDAHAVAPFRVVIGRDGRMLTTREKFERGDEPAMAQEIETALLARP